MIMPPQIKGNLNGAGYLVWKKAIESYMLALY